MDRIRWGILGTGAIVRGRFVNAIRGSQYGVVEAVASRSLEKARDFAQEFSIPGAFGSYQELIDNPNVDAVYIATPNSEHLAWAIACAEAGKPTLCEKPLASDANEARLLVPLPFLDIRLLALNSVIVCTASTLLSLLVGILAGISLARLCFCGWQGLE